MLYFLTSDSKEGAGLFPCDDVGFHAMSYLNIAEQAQFAVSSKDCISFYQRYCRTHPDILSALEFLRRFTKLYEFSEDWSEGTMTFGSLTIDDDDEHESQRSLTQQRIEIKEEQSRGWALRLLTKKLLVASAREGHIPVLFWLRERGISPDKDIVLQSVVSGKINSIQWCVDWIADFPSIKMSEVAAKFGHIHVLDWIHKTRKGIARNIVYIGATNGRLRVVRWGRENNFNWNKRVGLETQERSNCHTLWDAAYRGYSKIVRWCFKNGCPGINRSADHASASGKVPLLKWCVNKGSLLTDMAIVNAAKEGKKFAIIWCLAWGARWSPAAFLAAVRGDYIDLMRWMYNMGCLLPRTALEVVAGTHGNVEMATWLHNSGCPITADTAALAMENGNGPFMRWVLQRQVEYQTAFDVLAPGHFPII